MAKYPDVTAGQTEACINRMGGWDNFIRFIGGVGEIVFYKTLIHLRDIIVPTSFNSFVVRDHIVANMTRDVDVEVAWFSEIFKANFFGKIEGSEGEHTLSSWRLEKNSVDILIRAELGGYKETTLRDIFHLLAFQLHGQGGDLLVDGHANIFFVRNVNDNLWTVCVRWSPSSNCWWFEANSVENVLDQRNWRGGSQVFSSK